MGKYESLLATVLLTLAFMSIQSVVHAQLLPDVTSNISLIMTSDLPGDLTTVQTPNIWVYENLSTSSDKSTSIPLEWKNYTSKKHGFSIEYMSNATSITEGRLSKYDPDEDLKIEYPQLTFSVLELYTDFVPLNQTVKSFIDYITQEDLYYDGYWILISGLDMFKIGNETAYKFVLSRIDKESNRATVVQEVVKVEHNLGKFQLMFSALADDFDRTENIRNHMIDSIRWID